MQADLLLNWKNRFALQRACVKLHLCFISYVSLMSFMFVCYSELNILKLIP